MLHQCLNDVWVCFLSSDEIMQLDMNPPHAADIKADLRKQFAFLSGNSFIFPLRSVQINVYYCYFLVFTAASLTSGITWTLTGPDDICIVPMYSFFSTVNICYSNQFFSSSDRRWHTCCQYLIKLITQTSLNVVHNL